MSHGFKQSQSDHSLFIEHGAAGSFIALLIYVNDIIIASNDDNVVIILKTKLSKEFKLKDLEPLRYFLDLEVARPSAGISVCQPKYALELLVDTRYLESKLVFAPMEPNLKLFQDDGDLLSEPTEYRTLVGRLIYLTINRHDLIFLVNRLSQFLAAPCTTHVKEN